MIRNINLFVRSISRFGIKRQNYSNDSSKKDLVDKYIIINEDMVVCWHPEPKFPYECSKPLPLKQPEPKSVLKMPLEKTHKIFSPPTYSSEERGLNAEELAKLTYTTKHRWFPRARDKRSKKTKPDRTYL
ncbi:39S ribosomal protein L42, mitochondrial [Chelonus insularis]|uniref:39S ribosomal protein L42, mitochondrial n=1 Tax=Chelonus insularis TaxID=460826 RepID=UPI001589FDBD|nr:39S ribosomal protein L42, mitochondrial [Chelonus insularis]